MKILTFRFVVMMIMRHCHRQMQDKKTLNKINKLIKSIKREPFGGEGSPKPLKGNLSGFWSREIDNKNRLVYRIVDDERVEIAQCKGHYDDK